MKGRGARGTRLAVAERALFERSENIPISEIRERAEGFPCRCGCSTLQCRSQFSSANTPKSITHPSYRAKPLSDQLQPRTSVPTHPTPSEILHRLGTLKRPHHKFRIAQEPVFEITSLSLSAPGMIRFSHTKKGLLFEQSIHTVLGKRVGIRAIRDPSIQVVYAVRSKRLLFRMVRSKKRQCVQHVLDVGRRPADEFLKPIDLRLLERIVDVFD